MHLRLRDNLGIQAAGPQGSDPVLSYSNILKFKQCKPMHCRELNLECLLAERECCCYCCFFLILPKKKKLPMKSKCDNWQYFNHEAEVPCLSSNTLLEGSSCQLKLKFRHVCLALSSVFLLIGPKLAKVPACPIFS